MKKYMLYLGCCVLGVALVSCQPGYETDLVTNNASTTSGTQKRAEEVIVTVPYGQATAVPGTTISITLDNLLEDSRCPKGVECVWEGNAKVRLLLQTLPFDKVTMAELNTHTMYTTSVTYEGYEIHLQNLLPYPIYGVDVQLKDYKATLRIVKK